MRFVLDKKQPLFVAMAVLGFFVAAALAMMPQRVLAQTNILDYELEFGKMDGYFHKPQGVAVGQNGDIYVTDFDDHRVQVFDASGNFIGKWGWFGSDAGDLLQPVGIAVDDALDRVYVAEMGNERIQVFDTAGNHLFAFGTSGAGAGQFSDVHDVTISGKGIYVADTWNHRIQLFDFDGNFLHVWGSQGNSPGQFETPKAVAFFDGFVYVADSGNDRVQVFEMDGSYLWSFGATGAGPGQFDAPSGIAVDADGIYVVDSGNHRVQRFDLAGVHEHSYGAFGSALGQMNSPMGIAATIENDVSFFVTDSENHRVQRIDKYANVVQVLGSAVAPDGHLTQPMGIAHSEKVAERLFVADYGNNRIQVFSLEGDFLYGWNLNAQPVDVAIDPKEYNVWVVTQTGTVNRFDIDGNFLASWTPPFGPNPGQIGGPKSIAVDGQQHVYIANHWSGGGSGVNAEGRIHIADANGAYLATWGSTGTSQPNPPAPDTFHLPEDTELDALGKSLFVASNGQYRVKQIEIGSNAGINGILEYNTGMQRSPKAVAVGSGERLFVSDRVGRLSVFSPFNNLIHQQDRTTGGGPGEFRGIGDMEYTPENRDYPELLIFPEWENHRIQVFSLN